MARGREESNAVEKAGAALSKDAVVVVWSDDCARVDVGASLNAASSTTSRVSSMITMRMMVVASALDTSPIQRLKWRERCATSNMRERVVKDVVNGMKAMIGCEGEPELISCAERSRSL